MQVKLGDFGTAQRFEDLSATRHIRGGTKYFSSPSIWKKFNEG